MKNSDIMNQVKITSDQAENCNIKESYEFTAFIEAESAETFNSFRGVVTAMFRWAKACAARELNPDTAVLRHILY